MVYEKLAELRRLTIESLTAIFGVNLPSATNVRWRIFSMPRRQSSEESKRALVCSTNSSLRLALARRVILSQHTSFAQFLTSEDGQTTTALRHSALRWRSTHVHSAIAVAVLPRPISSASIAPRPSYLYHWKETFSAYSGHNRHEFLGLCREGDSPETT